MSFDIKLNNNYLLISNLETDIITDRPSKDIVFAKVSVFSDNFSVFYRDKEINGLCNIIWSDFTYNGTPFANKQSFEDFVYENTGQVGGGGGGSSQTGGATEGTLLEVKDLLAYSNTSQSIITGTNISVPSGFKSVLINSLGGTQVLNFGGGNTFEIGGGRRPTVISFEANELNSKNGFLEAITITGGTWQWVATNTL